MPAIDTSSLLGRVGGWAQKNVVPVAKRVLSVPIENIESVAHPASAPSLSALGQAYAHPIETDAQIRSAVGDHPYMSSTIPGAPEGLVEGMSRELLGHEAPRILGVIRDASLAHKGYEALHKGKHGEDLSEVLESDDDEQGGHAGGGAASEEELARAGNHYVVDKAGNLTYHGKAFDPGSIREGAAHVTVLPNGTVRTNAGEMSPQMYMAVRRVMK